MFLGKPKVLKEQKQMTSRIMAKEDTETVLVVIKENMLHGSIGEAHAQQFSGIVLFGAYTGQRPYSTIAQLRVEQFREALQLEKSVVQVEAAQDKIRMSHYVTIHPQLNTAVNVLCEGRDDATCMFALESIRKWTQKQRIPLTRCKSYFIPSDLRKFAEQYGDVIGWNESNRAYVLTHGVRGVEWSNYRHLLPEFVYDVYMKNWNDVCFVQ